MRCAWRQALNADHGSHSRDSAAQAPNGRHRPAHSSGTRHSAGRHSRHQQRVAIPHHCVGGQAICGSSRCSSASQAAGVASGASSFSARPSSPCPSITAVSMCRLRRRSRRCSTLSCRVQAWIRRRATLLRSRVSRPRSTVSLRSLSLSRKPWYCSSASATDSARMISSSVTSISVTVTAPAIQPRCRVLA